MIRRLGSIAAFTVLVATATHAFTQTPATGNVDAALARLVSSDFPTRTRAARDIRRAPRETVIPALVRAVRTHQDEYIRFRALVLLSGFGAPETPALMREVMTDRNDRLRTVAYQWFEHRPDSSILPILVATLERENSEFVRPALTRAIAAQAADPRARAALLPLVLRGEDLFRGAVIDALGDYRVSAAISPITDVAHLDGPLQDDAVTALGELGNPESRTTLVTLQPSAPRELQPTIAAALCLIGTECDTQAAFVKESLTFSASNPDAQPLLRGAVHAMTMLALHGRPAALETLLDAGVAARDPARGVIALGVGRVALRNPVLLLRTVETRSDVAGSLALVLDAFDMLSEDFEEEQFFVEIRQALWAAPEGSARRRTAESLIAKLEF